MPDSQDVRNVVVVIAMVLGYFVGARYTGVFGYSIAAAFGAALPVLLIWGSIEWLFRLFGRGK